MQPSGDRDRPRARLFGALCAAALTAVTLTACTTGDSTDNASAVTQSSGSNGSLLPVPPGKYAELPEPCGAIGAETLHLLVPNAQDYAGEAVLTYDTDRRVGCRWTGRTDQGNRYLHIDLERVVSYDPAVSDERQAALDYDSMASEADIPPVGSTSSTMPTASESPGAPLPTDSPGSESVSPPPAALAPRALAGLGDTAFLDDTVATRDSGIHRDVLVVTRTANVVITVDYSQWSTDMQVVPGSEDLQDGAQRVAAVLVERFDG